ncbi:MAG TPA: prepilin-type N-terminal cleavage/methylation domain-containing protein [Desulfurivibrio alkaliphilus]|uniref:Prepilin-type N-terminal cleavage/methylation domain-containing protein n=1 Tax=Desulfurivibrio alkaliphilus TaxID=427923 RepID=A0A7C2X9E8_9BACT|nr:prepilin-type N-terminal cleavage/methylation domain-containing protein [Desulfurivibrio alkaliphilus]
MTGAAGARQGGFTLIEVIVAITIVAIMGAMLFVFLSSTMVRSYQPLRMTGELAELQREMEEAVGAYNQCQAGGYLQECWSAFKSDYNCVPLSPAELAGFGTPDFAICKVEIPAGQPVLVGYFTYDP